MNFSRITCRQFITAVLVASLFAILQSFAPLSKAAEDPPVSFTKCWDYFISPDLSTEVQSDSDSVYFVDADRKLSAVDLATGSKSWTSDLAGEPVSNLLVSNGMVIVASRTSPDKAVVRAVSRATGITQWSADLSSNSLVSLGSLNGTVVALMSNGQVAAIHTDRGSLAWSKEIGSSLTTAPVFHGRTLVVGTQKKEVIGLDVHGGDARVISKTEGTPTALFPGGGNNLLVGDDRGNLDLSSLDGRREWRFRNGARISSIAVFDSEYVATSHDNFVYKLTRHGNVEWKRRLSARIGKRPVVVEKVGVVPTVGDGVVYVIDLSNGKIVNKFETGDESTAQVTGGTSGFAVVSVRGLAFYSSQPCSKNKKTAAESVPS